jgi:hypothetical protein
MLLLLQFASSAGDFSGVCIFAEPQTRGCDTLIALIALIAEYIRTSLYSKFPQSGKIEAGFPLRRARVPAIIPLLRNVQVPHLSLFVTMTAAVLKVRSV